MIRKPNSKRASYLTRSSPVQTGPAYSLTIPLESHFEWVRLERTRLSLLRHVQSNYANKWLITLHLHAVFSMEHHYVIRDTEETGSFHLYYGFQLLKVSWKYASYLKNQQLTETDTPLKTRSVKLSIAWYTSVSWKVMRATAALWIFRNFRK